MRYRLLIIVLFLSIFFISPHSINAVENNTLFTKSSLSIVGNKITLKMYVKSDEKISGILIPWSYDKDKLTLVSLSSSNFSATYQDPQGNLTRNILLDSAKEFQGEIELFQVVFELNSDFKIADKALITFNPGQLANYKNSYKMNGASFEVTHGSSNTLNINYSVIPISTNIKTNSVDSNKMMAANNVISDNLEDVQKSDNISAIDTGYDLPVIALVLLLVSFFMVRNSKSKVIFQRI